MTIDDIKKICEESGFGYYGLRADNMEYNVGDICNNSHQLFQDPAWDEYGELIYKMIDDPESPYYGFYDAGELDGTCAVKFSEEDDESIKNALDTIRSYTYSGSHIYIIGGYDREYGNDEDEVIIREAEIVGIIE